MTVINGVQIAFMGLWWAEGQTPLQTIAATGFMVGVQGFELADNSTAPRGYTTLYG